MIRPARRLNSDEGGQVIVLVAVLFLALVFMVALVVNTGQLFIQRRTAQGAADAAALAGAYSLSLGDPTATAKTAACGAVSLSGYTDVDCPSAVPGGKTVTVTVNITDSGPRDEKFVEVILTTRVSATLVPEWGLTAVRVRAVAGSGSEASPGIFAIGGGDIERALRVGANGSLTICAFGTPRPHPRPTPVPTPVPLACPSGVPGGIAQVNSTAAKPPNCAAYNQQSKNDYSKSPPTGVGPTGPPGVGATIVTPGCVQGFWPNKIPNASAVPGDPYLGKMTPDAVGAPDPSTNWCRRRDWVSGLRPCASDTNNHNTDATLQPGVYTGNKLSGNAKYTLMPGIYVFRGSTGGISLGGSGSLEVDQLTPSNTDDGKGAFARCGNQDGAVGPCGVLLFFTYTNWPATAPTGGCATFKTNTGARLNLDPEPDGTWQGWLMWYFRAPAGYCDGLDVSLGGNANLNLSTTNGLIYVPGGTLTLDGNGVAASLTQVVTSQIYVKEGSLHIEVGAPPSRPKGPPRLAE